MFGRYHYKKVIYRIFNIDFSKFCIPPIIQLSDNSFNKNYQIDILLGRDRALRIFICAKRATADLIFQNTFLGYIVSGTIPTKQFCNFGTLKKFLKCSQSLQVIKKLVKLILNSLEVV